MSGWAGAQNLHAESGKAIHYSGMTDCFRRTVQEEGARALFKVISHNTPDLKQCENTHQSNHQEECAHNPCCRPGTYWTCCCMKGTLELADHVICKGGHSELGEVVTIGKAETVIATTWHMREGASCYMILL